MDMSKVDKADKADTISRANMLRDLATQETDFHVPEILDHFSLEETRDLIRVLQAHRARLEQYSEEYGDYQANNDKPSSPCMGKIVDEKEHRFRTIIAKSVDGIVIVDEHGLVCFMNPSAESMFGHTTEELVGEPFGFPIVAGETVELDIFHRGGTRGVAEMRVVETEWEGSRVYLATFRDITERKQNEHRQMARVAVTSILAKSETLGEALPDLLHAICEVTKWEFGEIWLVDFDAYVLRWNTCWHAPALDMTTLEHCPRTMSFSATHGLYGRVWAHGRPEQVDNIAEMCESCRATMLLAHGLSAAIAFPVLKGRDVIGVMSFFCRAIYKPDGEMIKIMSDVGSQVGQFIARKRAEDELRNAHRALRTLNECNQALIHATDESTFLHDICRVIVEVGGYRMAWAGFAENTSDKEMPVQIIARAAYEDTNLETIEVTWGNTEKAYGPIATAIHSGVPCVSKNILTDSSFAHLHAQATMYGFASSVALPLSASTAYPFGVLNIYAEEPEAFGREEVKLLMEMANDLAYGIIALRTRAERDRAERALRLYTERLKNMREIDQAILTAQTTDAIAQAALSHIRRLVPYQWASIVGFEADANQPVTLVADARSNDVDELSFVAPDTRQPMIISREPYGVQHGTARYVEDILDMPDRTPMLDQLLKAGVRSYITAPLIADGQLMGEINLRATSPYAFNKQHLSIAREVADQMAVAIHHARLFEQVRDGRERLQTLSRRLMEVQEVERDHIARELHDDIGQSLTAVKISLQAIQRVPEAAAISSNLEESIKIVDRALQRVRNLSLDLRPSLLDDLGLVAALRWYVDRQAQWAGFTAEFIPDPFMSRLPPELETVCFRVTQEALTNVVRHAHATHVRIELEQHDNELALIISDDGAGFDVREAQQRATRGSSLGLLGMQERVLFAGGQMDIISAPEQGTRIYARFPLSCELEPL